MTTFYLNVLCKFYFFIFINRPSLTSFNNFIPFIIFQFGTDKEIKVENLDELSDEDDLSVDQNAFDENETVDQNSFDENDKSDENILVENEEQEYDKTPFDKKQKTIEVFSAKVTRSKRKSAKKFDPEKIILEDFGENFDEIEDEEVTKKGRIKRRKLVAQDSGPPFDCDICGSTFDAYTAYRYE